MGKQRTEHLVQLIHSLTKAEKRHFKVYAKRVGGKDDLKFLQLFNALDKQDEYNEEQLLKKVPSLKREQLSNLKAHLYKQLLISLRLNHSNDHIDIQVRERIDYARVLYNKGLYHQSLRVLDKAKSLAITGKLSLLHLEVVDFEKFIESQFITHSIETRADQLTFEADTLSETVSITGKLSNLALKLYGLYLQVGYTRNQRDFLQIQTFFRENLPAVKKEALGFNERLFLFQSYVWYHYIIQDFLMCYRYAQQWIDLFKQNPEMILQLPDLYLKGMHNLMAALFNIQHDEKFEQVLGDLQAFGAFAKELKFTENTERQYFLYNYTNQLNYYFLSGQFTEGLQIVPEIEAGIERLQYKLDHHRILVFYYKIGCLYFGSGDNKKAIQYLNKIINFRDTSIHGDIQCYARILCLIAHFELENSDLVEYQVRSVYRFLAKMDDLHLVQKEILKFIQTLRNIAPSELKQAFETLLDRLLEHAKAPYEKRAFLYLDIISWLECKIQGRPVQTVIREKYLERKKYRMRVTD